MTSTATLRRAAGAPMTRPCGGYLDDMRFRALLGAAAWERLPAAVRARFAKRLLPGRSVSYAGQVVTCTMRPVGWLLAQGCRLIGSPLPLGRDAGVAAVVTVTEDGASGGQVWTRMYARPRGFPQVIHSAKRFAGPTGLEEYLGAGFGIALAVEACERGIRFRSDHYFLAIGPVRLRLPRWLAPGALSIDHQDRGEGAFAFTLSLRHRLLGEIIRQVGHFHDQPALREEAE
ncbi:DUF4166 domain-containing protein [Novosphingobium resinovorum]|uniref:DUF4166 domain-containing protein n=1 Tax=Novosphingobium resinovorum TaxID=158500 RepID=UPI002ED490D3|nr:DUF4166 domain-containing protein [Novosphingobium resinovorum]